MGYSLPPRFIIYSTETAVLGIRHLYRCALHITGVAAMVLLFLSYQGILTKNGLRMPTALKPIYLSKRERFALKDLEIKFAYVGEDIIAIIDDPDETYGFMAVRTEKGYDARMHSSYQGVITAQKYPVDHGHRQMVMDALANHWDAMEQQYEQILRSEARTQNPGLN